MLVYATIAFLIFNTCFTIIFVPYTSLTAAMTDDYNERTSLTGYRMAGSLSSMFLGAVVPTAILALIAAAYVQDWLTLSGINAWFGSWAGTPRQAYFVMGALFAIVMTICTWIAFRGTRERHLETTRKIGNPLSYASHIVDELKMNRPYRISVLILLITNTAATFVAANLVYYIQYVLRLGGHTGFLFSTLFFTAICCVPFWVSLAKRYGKARTYRYAMLVYAGVVICLTLLPPGIPLWPYLVAVGAGAFHSAALTLPWAIIPDVVEYDELKTGKRREGLFYGGSTFCYKLATTIPPVVSLRVLNACEYVPNLEIQAPAVTLGIRTLVGVVPALLLVGGAVLSRHYPLTENKHREIVDELNKRRTTNKSL
jgi:GPH family glycoside/pentoside/hexuronide:cation symporter